MPSVLSRFPELSQATVNQKLELIDELWESIRRSEQIEVPQDHLTELNRRLEGIKRDESLALDPVDARALLRR